MTNARQLVIKMIDGFVSTVAKKALTEGPTSPNAKKTKRVIAEMNVVRDFLERRSVEVDDQIAKVITQ